MENGGVMAAKSAAKDASRNEDWNSEALAAANVGLWVIDIDRNTGHISMLANPVTLRLLGASEEMTPAECFNFWVDRVDARSRPHLWAIHDEFIADTAMHEVRYSTTIPRGGWCLCAAAGGASAPIMMMLCGLSAIIRI